MQLLNVYINADKKTFMTKTNVMLTYHFTGLLHHLKHLENVANTI